MNKLTAYKLGTLLWKDPVKWIAADSILSIL